MNLGFVFIGHIFKFSVPSLVASLQMQFTVLLKFFRILYGFCVIGSFIWNTHYQDEMIASLSVPKRPSQIGNALKIKLLHKESIYITFRHPGATGSIGNASSITLGRDQHD